MTPDDPLYRTVLLAVFIAAPIVALALTFINAPYGRHDSTAWGPGIDARVSWVLVEGASFFAFGIFYLAGPRAFDPLPLLFFLLYEAHYLHRTFIFPFRLKGKARKHRLPILVFGLSFNTANGYQLEHLPGIGPTLAWRIAEHIATHGPFETVDDLAQVDGISAEAVDRLRPFVCEELTQ